MKKQKILISMLISLVIGFMCFGAKVFAVNDVMYVKSEVNFRSEQSTSSKSYGMIPGGTEVTVLEKNSNGWYEVEYDGKTGYVSKTYLTENEPENTDNESTDSKKEEKEDNSLGLETLTIEHITLNPEFKKNTYEYTGELTEQVTSLNVDAKSNDEDADIQISGNEGLVDGENIITILVKSSNETTTYQITIDKKSEEEIAALNEQENGGMQINPTIAIGTAVALLAILIIVLVIRNHSKNKISAREFSMPYEPRREMETEQREENTNKEKYKEQYLNQFGKANMQDEEVPKQMINKKEETTPDYNENDERNDRKGRGKHF